MKSWTEQNISQKPYSKEYYTKDLTNKLRALENFGVQDLASNYSNKEIKRRIQGSLTEKLLSLQSYNQNLKTDIPVYNNNVIVGNMDALNKNGIYIDIKTKDQIPYYRKLDIKVSGNYFNTIHLINAFYNIEKTHEGLRLSYMGYLNIVKELSQKEYQEYQVQEKSFSNETGKSTGKYTCFEFSQSRLIKKCPFNLTLTDIFNE